MNPQNILILLRKEEEEEKKNTKNYLSFFLGLLL